MSVNHINIVRRHNRDIFSILYKTKVWCVVSFESLHRGDSNEYTQYTIYNIYIGLQKSDMLYIDIYYSRVCASYALIFHSAELSDCFLCYKNMFLHVSHLRSCALVFIPANCYADTLH